MKLPNLPSLTTAEATTLELWVKALESQWVESLRPAPDAFGMRMLPREPGNPNKFLSTFKTETQNYQIIGDNGIGFDRYSIFQKRSIQRGYGRDFLQLHAELDKIKMGIAGESAVARIRTDAIMAISGLQDSVADMSKEQFDAALWLCTLFVLREDETMATYSEQIAEEKIKDWAAYGYSELDFFFLSGNLVPGYLAAFRKVIIENQQAREKLLAAIGTN